jgi:hypothetical protein
LRTIDDLLSIAVVENSGINHIRPCLQRADHLCEQSVGSERATAEH